MENNQGGVFTIITGDRSSGKTFTLWFKFLVPKVNAGVKSVLITRDFNSYIVRVLKPHILPEQKYNLIHYCSKQTYEEVLLCIENSAWDGVTNFAIDESPVIGTHDYPTRLDEKTFIKSLVLLANKHGLNISFVKAPIRLEFNDTRPLLPSYILHMVHEILFCYYESGEFKTRYLKDRFGLANQI